MAVSSVKPTPLVNDISSPLPEDVSASNENEDIGNPAPNSRRSTVWDGRTSARDVPVETRPSRKFLGNSNKRWEPNLFMPDSASDGRTSSGNTRPIWP